jgi:hypothetical protein
VDRVFADWAEEAFDDAAQTRAGFEADERK